MHTSGRSRASATVSQVCAFCAPPCRNTNSGAARPHTSALNRRPGSTSTNSRRTAGGPANGSPNSSAFSWNSANSSYWTRAISEPRPSVTNLLEKRHDRVVEQIVAVARDHVAGARDVGEAGVRHELEQLLRPFLAQQVAHATTHQQHRDGELLRRDP